MLFLSEICPVSPILALLGCVCYALAAGFVQFIYCGWRFISVDVGV